MSIGVVNGRTGYRLLQVDVHVRQRNRTGCWSSEWFSRTATQRWDT